MEHTTKLKDICNRYAQLIKWTSIILLSVFLTERCMYNLFVRGQWMNMGSISIILFVSFVIITSYILKLSHGIIYKQLIGKAKDQYTYTMHCLSFSGSAIILCLYTIISFILYRPYLMVAYSDKITGTIEAIGATQPYYNLFTPIIVLICLIISYIFQFLYITIKLKQPKIRSLIIIGMSLLVSVLLLIYSSGLLATIIIWTV